MDNRNQDAPRRRTISNKKASTENLKKLESKSSFVSFFFGGKSAQTASVESKSIKSDGGSKPSRLVINRANSNASMSSAVSKKSELSLESSSLKGSTRSQQSFAQQSRVSEEEEEDMLENKAIEVSLRLQLWESATGKKSSKSKSPKSKRSLNRETSYGSNASNISALTNNSNISILSSSSNGSLVSSVDKGSRPSSFRHKKAPYDPAAAAALNRQRFFGDTGAAPQVDVQCGLRNSSVQPQLAEKPVLLPDRQEQLLLQHNAADSQTLTISTAASQALTAPSSTESSPANSPRTLQRGEQQQESFVALEESENAKPDLNQQPAASSHSFPSSAPISTSTSTTHSPSPVPIPKPALKSPVREGVAKMEALPNRSADIKNTRQSWIANASNHISPRVVKFSSSTKSMHSLISLDGRGNSHSRDSNNGGEKEAKVSVSVGASGPTKDRLAAGGIAPSNSDVDLLEIEGAIMVEDEEEEETGAVAVAKVGEEPKVEVAAAPTAVSAPNSQPTPVIPSAAGQPAQPAGQHSLIPLAELVRRNAAKEYEGISRQELEVYLSDEDFKKAFRMERGSFSVLPLWRQQSFKRSVGLF